MNFILISHYVFKSSSASIAMIAYNVLRVFASLVWPFYLCHFATFATKRIMDLSQTVYNSNWLDWAPEFRKYSILIMARSQQPVYFNGLGLIYCSLGVFGKVRQFRHFDHSKNAEIVFFSFQLLKTSCSYYLLFRNISHR